MMTDDIRDLLGRYATGSLTAEEQKRLFDAALDDQELFEELAREDEMKELVAAPGVRSRLIRALQPPKRRPVPWVLALAPVAILSAVLMVILMRPVPKPQQMAVATAPTSTAPLPAPVSEPQPSGVPARVKRKAVERVPERPKEEHAQAENAEKKDLDRRVADEKEAVPKDAAPKAADQVAAALQSPPFPHPSQSPPTKS